MKKLSVVILTCNQLSDTLKCLKSLNPASCTADDVEVILVDNGSSDNTADEVERNFPEVTVLILPLNAGVAAGRNAGIKKAEGKYIVLLDNDTLPSKELIHSMMKYMDDNPGCGLAAPQLVNADGSVQPNFKRYPGLCEKIRNVVGQSKVNRGGEIHPCYVMGACQIFRSELIEKVGLLDENIFYGPEDADFCLRISASGYTVDAIPELTLVHNHRKATRRQLLSPLARRHFSALIYFWKKHRRWW